MPAPPPQMHKNCLIESMRTKTSQVQKTRFQKTQETVFRRGKVYHFEKFMTKSSSNTEPSYMRDIHSKVKCSGVDF